MVEVQTSEGLWGDFFFGKGNLTVAEITPRAYSFLRDTKGKPWHRSMTMSPG